MLFKTVIAEILRDVAPTKRSSTQERYYYYLSLILEDLASTKLESFSRKDFISWIRLLRKKKSSRNTFNDFSKFMNIIFNFAYQEKYISHRIKFPLVDGERETAGRVYSESEVNRLAKNMNETTLLQFILSYECFMRLREVLHLTWDRVDLEQEVIILRKQDVKTGSKCGKGRVVPLSTNAVRYLSERREQAKTDFVFPSPNGKTYVDSNKKKWIQAKRAAGIVGRARWHDIRHTALTVAIIIKKLPLAHVSKVAGVSIRTLERVYLHHQVEHLREITKSMNCFKAA